MSDPLLPSDVFEQALDPEVCEQCQLSENRIEDMQDALSDCLEFLNDFEIVTRVKEFKGTNEAGYRKELLSCIERVKKLA